VRQYLRELIRRRDLIINLVSSGLKAQHRNNLLGYFWWLLDPLLGVLIYYFVVVVILNSGGDNYGAYLVIGMIIWRWTNTTIASASNSIVTQAGLIKQIYLPKALFPLCVSLTQLFNFGFGLIVMGVFFVFFRISPGIQLLVLPYVIITQLVFLLALSLLFAFISVYIRDMDMVLSHLLRLWFYGSPVIWMVDLIPERLDWLLKINPMYYFLSGYRSILMDNAAPSYLALTVIGLLSMAAILVMINLYRKYEHNMVKIL
jgi:ABC-type polysaccharide/polyol phosphate export permease